MRPRPLLLLPLLGALVTPTTADAAPARLVAEIVVGGAAAQPVTVPIGLGERVLGEISDVDLEACFSQEGSPSNACDAGGTVTLAPGPAPPFFLAGVFREVLATGVVTPATFPLTLHAGERLQALFQWVVDRVGPVSGTFTLVATVPGDPPETHTFNLSGSGLPLDGCFPLFNILCLGGDRFKIEGHFLTPGGERGEAHRFRLTNDTGYLWFFSPSNVEAVIKVLNGCPVNDRHWVFAGGLTNVRTLFTVLDTSADAVRIYVNPQNRPFQPIQDTGAFATCP